MRNSSCRRRSFKPSIGNFCEDYALTEPSGRCAAGFYCTSGAYDEEGQNCFDLEIYEADYDPGAATNITLIEVNASLISYLDNCGDDGGPCTAGHFCLEGAGYPEPCALGTYYPSTQNSGACTTCDPGYACDDTGLASADTLCEAGYFCKNTANGAESATPLCLDESCADDYGLCPIGHYCSQGTVNPEPCNEGTYAPYAGFSACATCPPGHFCNGTKTDAYFECPRGFYCPAGTGSTLPACPPGRYGHASGLRSEIECALCPAGWFCESFESPRASYWLAQVRSREPRLRVETASPRTIAHSEASTKTGL